jgi:ferredoxin
LKLSTEVHDESARAEIMAASEKIVSKGCALGNLEVTKEPGIRVTIDPKRCVANARCTYAAPGIFTLDEETGVATIENEDLATVEQFFAAARVCPTQAITIEQFGRRVFPQILTPMFGQKQEESAE